MAYMRDSTGRRLDSFEAISRQEADGLYSVGASGKKLYGYHAMLGLARTAARCDVLVIGDSIAEGQGAPTSALSWRRQAEALIRAEYTTGPQGAGYRPTIHVATNNLGAPLDTGFTRSGATNQAGYGGTGIGAKAVQLNYGDGTTDPTTGRGTLTVTQTCTSFTVFSQRQGTSESFTVTIDGGAPITVSTPDSTKVRTWNSGPLTPGEHTIVIRQNGSNTSGPSIAGLWFYNGDETAGFSIIDGSYSGARMADWITGGNKGFWQRFMPFITPSLVVLTCITNDIRVNAGNVTAAQYATATQTLINELRAGWPNIPILLMPPFEPQGGIAHREPWENYMAELARIADENPYVAFYDMSARVEVNPDTYGVLLDGTHTTAKGSALLANLVREALTPA